MHLKMCSTVLRLATLLLCLNLGGCGSIHKPVVQKNCLKIFCVIIDNVILPKS